MGSSQSTNNVINNIVNDVTSTWMSTSADAAIVGKCENIIETDADCVSMTLNNVTQDCSYVADLNLMVTSVQKSTSSADIKKQITQKATEAAQSIQFSLTVQDTNQIINDITNICMDVYESVSSGAVVDVLAKNAIVCKAGNQSLINVKQYNIVNACVTSTLTSDQSSATMTSLTDTLDQYSSEEVKNSLYALALVILAIGAVIMSPAIGAGYFVKQGAKNNIVLMGLAVMFLVSTNAYLDMECIKHSFPVAHFPPYVKSLGIPSIPILPAWCKTTTAEMISFGFTWIIFACMMYVAYHRTDAVTTLKPGGSVAVPHKVT